MPLYLYQCSKCEHNEELIRKVEERDKSTKCEQCKGKMKRVTTATAMFDLKGTGFYKGGKSLPKK